MQLCRAFLALLVLLLGAPASLAQVSSSSSSGLPGVGGSSSSSSAIVDVSSSSSGSPAFGFSSSSSSSSAAVVPPSSASLAVDITFPNSLVTQGVAGVGWLIDINLSALTASANALLTPPAFIPGFRNGAGTPFSSVHSPGVNPDAPGLVVLLSTTSNNSVTLLGPNTNLAGLFEVNAPAVSSAGLNEFRLVWWVGATAFGTNVNSTLTVFVVSGTAPAFLTTSPEATPNLISNIATTLFSISGPTSLTASTSTFTGPSPADPSAVNVKVFTPAPGDTIGVDAFNFVVDLRAITTSPQFNPLLSEGAGYFPRFANASNATQVHVGAFLTAPGVVVLLNTTTLGTGANTNLAGLFQINALNTLATANGEVNEIWMDWQAGKPAFGSGPCQLTVFILNDTAPTSISGAPEEQPGLISNIVTVDFFISPPAGASGSGSSSTGGAVIPPPTSGALNVDITFPNSLVTQGVAGVGWLIDINLSALTASANALLTPPAFIPGFRNGAGTPFSSVHSPGVNPDAPGLVVLLSTTSNNSVTLLGPNTNLAGLFEVNAPAVSSAGLNEFRLVWWVGATAFGTNVNSTLTVFVVSGTAPAFLTTSPEATPNLISNIATTLFSISGPTSLTASTSTFTGPSPADPSAVNVKVFTPAPGDTIGVDAFNFVVDLRAITTSPQFNPLLSEGAGYFPRFANASNATQVHVGAFLTAPGVVVLLNTTTLGTGANTNLAGLFQINALNTLATANGEVNEIWMDWQAGKPAFGSGPCQLTVFILNDTAPTSISGAPEEQPGLISNIVTVDFFISAPAGATVLGDPSFSGFHGQAPFQVHGIPGAVFNILTAQQLQLNSLFTFLDHGDAMTAAEMGRARLASFGRLPVTQPWSHPGTYLSQLGLKLGAIELLVGAGSYSEGVAYVTLANGESHEQSQLAVGGTVSWCDTALTWVDASHVAVQTPLVSFTIVNADGFFNIEQAKLLSSAAHLQLDGLLGQSADPQWKAGKGREWEEHMLMDYLVLDEELPAQQLLLSNEFRANKFANAADIPTACARQQ